MAKILLVEDDPGVAQLIRFTLESDRHVLDHHLNCSDALIAIRTNEYNLMIFDWALPDSTGVDLCKQYRSMGGAKPILMLTARGSSQDKVAGLSAGADDYVVKPFDPDELLARVKALLRRPPMLSDSILKVGVLELDKENFTVKRDGQPVTLLPKEFAILALLMEHSDRHFTAEAILGLVWRSEANVSTDSVRTQMKSLRKKLGGTEETSLIENTRGLGYRLRIDA